MPITSINFSTSQENINKIGLRSWKKFGAEYQLDKGEDLEFAKKALKDFVYASLKAQPETMPEEIIQTKEPDTPQSKEDALVATIEYCASAAFLEKFKTQCTTARTKEAYEKKLAQLKPAS